MEGFTKNTSSIKKKTIIDVTFSPLIDEIDFNQKCISLVEQWYSEKNQKGPNHGVINHFSLEETVDFINKLSKKTKKNNAPNLLKGIYEGGTRGEFCKDSTNLLFFDIDVKKQTQDKKGENQHLFDAKLNSDVFDYLQTICVFVFRSHSGFGIAGALYVPYLKGLLVDKKDLHKKIGDKICSELTRLINKEINIKVQFDEKQNTFRQIRKVYPQEVPVKLNSNPIQININITEEDHITRTGVPIFKSHYGFEGSVRYQFNENTPIEYALLDNGFYKVSDNRWRHPSTSSDSTGQVNADSNTFYSHSSSYGEGLYTPFDVYARSKGMSSHEFTKILKPKYEVIPAKKDVIESAIISLNNDNLGSQEIFELCNPLTSLTIPQRYDFIEKLNVSQQKLNHVHEYLKVPELTIRYDLKIIIKDFLSSNMEEVMNFVSDYKMTCIYAGTGYGKTRGTIEYFKAMKNQSSIFLSPLQSIVTQTAKDFDIPYLTGDSNFTYHSKAKSSNIFVCTYEQGVKHIATKDYDYIIIDEVHKLYTSNNYRDILVPLASLLNESKSKIIGLTGTPNSIISNLGFKIIKCEKESIPSIEVIERFTNKSGYATAINHIRDHGGKCLIRLNSQNNLDSIKAELIEKNGYDEREILVLFSDNRVKKGDEYRMLIEKGLFPNYVKIVLTTSLIDEGVNIHDKDFDSVVFIESNVFNPRPEPIPQFFNRLRNHDTETKYYLYRKYSLNYNYNYMNEQDHYYKTIKTLETWSNQFDDYLTYANVFNNNKYFLMDGCSINKPYVAYNTTLTSFGRFTPYMLDKYLENYNIKTIRDENFIPKKIDRTFKNKWDKDAKLEIRDLWAYHFNTVLSTLHYEAQDKNIRERIKECDFDLEWEDEYIEAVRKHLKTFEKYYSYYMQIEVLGYSPHKFIVREKSLTSIQKLNNEVYYLETMSILNNPRSKGDEKNKTRILGVINGLADNKKFTRGDIDKAFDTLHLINKPSYEVIDRIIKHFYILTYNKKTKTYTVKGKR